MRAQTILRSGVLDDDDDHRSILYVQAEQTVTLRSLCGWLGGGGGGDDTFDTIVPSDLFPRRASGYRIEQNAICPWMDITYRSKQTARVRV
jgi:hypothetical protein